MPVKTARLAFVVLPMIVLPTLVQANITGYFNSIGEAAYQVQTPPSGSFNYLYANSSNGSFGSVNDPLTTNNFAGGSTSTAASATAFLNINAPQLLDIGGNISGYGDASYSGLNNLYSAYGYAFDYVGFTLDAPGTITVSTTGPVTTSIAGSGYLQLTTNLDGNYVGPVGTWNLSAGSHWIQLYVQGRGLAGYYSGNFYGRSGTGTINEPFDIRVQSVPEPTTLAVLGIGIAAGLRRRKQSR